MEKLLLTPERVLQEIHSFYKTLYTSESAPENGELASNFVASLDIPTLSDEAVLALNKPISKNEVWETLKSMGSDNSPGLDGLPSEFYVTFFNDIIDLLLESYDYSFKEGLLSVSQRSGLITRIPKKDKDPLYVKNYRPISLLNVDYKLLAKVMSTRLKLCMSSLIHIDQQGFMKGRNISSNIRTIIDLIEYTDVMNESGSIVLLDFEKAFDRVEHQYLFWVLNRFNLGMNFPRWIKTFYKDRNSCVLNNGFLSKPVDIRRGIFQGCPISPLLFLLAIEILAIAVRSNSNIKGIQIGTTEKKINLFADDTICFLMGRQIRLNIYLRH